MYKSWSVSSIIHLGSNAPWPSNVGCAIAALITYPLICLVLRYRRLRQTSRLYPYPTRASLASMTDTDAACIQSVIAELEFPFIFEKALQFALFRTYGIPSISSLLAATTQLSDPSTSCKRYSDTEILIAEFIAHAPNSARSRQAIARMNYIHSGYQRAGKISNDDMLYTLSLFACEPVRWINRFEWRQLEGWEVCAIGTFWKSVGDAMGISYDPLPGGQSGSGSGDGGGGGGVWKDGLEWFDDIKAWSEAYEAERMVPAQTNHQTAEETTRILLWPVPGPLQGYARYAVYSLMDQRLRRAMMYPDPPAFLIATIHATLRLRAFCIRHLALPRPYFMRCHHMTTTPSPDGTYHYLKYDAAPYYVRPSLLGRYSPKAWYLWSMGLPLPGDAGGKYHPEGYKITEMGPKGMQGKGREYMDRVQEELSRTRTGGCVFAR